MSLCKRCGKELTGHQQSYCSQYCGKLHLKALYRIRKRDQIRAYNRDYKRRKAIKLKREYWETPVTEGVVLRKSAPKLGPKRLQLIQELGGKCVLCATEDNLTINHRIPRSAGGSDERSNLEVMCMRCNMAEYKRVVAEAMRLYIDLLKREGVA